MVLQVPFAPSTAQYVCLPRKLSMQITHPEGTHSWRFQSNLSSSIQTFTLLRASVSLVDKFDFQPGCAIHVKSIEVHIRGTCFLSMAISNAGKQAAGKGNVTWSSTASCTNKSDQCWTNATSFVLPSVNVQGKSVSFWVFSEGQCKLSFRHYSGEDRWDGFKLLTEGTFFLCVYAMSLGGVDIVCVDNSGT